jgi:hypothetical protein
VIVATLASALVGSGVLPPDHLHQSDPAESHRVHAHWESTTHQDAPAAFSAHEDHDDAVTLDRVLAAGPAQHVPGQPAALPQPAWIGAITTAGIFLADPVTAPGPSPPPRPSAPRAPPAR